MNFFACHLEMASEKKAPPKPTMPPKRMSEVRVSPLDVSMGPTPRMFRVTLASNMTAKLVASSSRMRIV